LLFAREKLGHANGRATVITDYHMHLRNERGEIAHETSAVEPFVEAAQSAGVDELGFTEHVYYFRQTRSLWTVPYQTERCVYDLERYVEAVVQARERGLPVKLGLEVDYVPGREDETRELLEPYPWDYLLGSVHFIDGLGVDGEPRLLDAVGVDEAWRRYFDALGDAARSGLFDSLSHPDLVKIFGTRPSHAYDYEPVVDAIAEAGVAVEVSTAGLHKPVRELYPHPDFLAACHARGVPATLASDAHAPGEVGRDFGRARELLRAAGYETITVFETREARQEPLG
jgi:histidinol-phosphatase (PHP family)